MKLAYIFMALILIGMVNAFTITSPEVVTYDYNDILFIVEHNETLDSISYSLDNSSDISLCTNCSTSNTTLSDLTEGEHTIKTVGTLGNDTLEREITFTIDLLPVFSIDIDSPKAKVYNTNTIELEADSELKLEKMSYILDNSSEVIACTNCSEFNKTMNLTEGTHTLKVFGTLEGITKNDTVEFEIDAVDSFNIAVKDPKAMTYYDKNVKILVESNITLDIMTVEVGTFNWTCTDCSKINHTVELNYGNYSLKAKGYLEDWTKTVFVDFKVMETVVQNDTDDDEDEDDDTNKTYSNESRFTTGFEKLPKMVENGELTDAELADIIRNNKLNPGILNRLIKTGMLGNESINAILDTQFQPQGIFKKLIGKMGFKNTYASKIANKYNLTEENKEKIVQREDLPKKTKEKMQKEIGNSTKTPPGQAKKLGDKDNNSNKVSPGQAKKSGEENSSGNGGGKTPPGQAKKNK